MKFHECQRFVAYAECRRLLRHQIVKRFSEAYARIFVYVNTVTADASLDNILMNVVFN